ncbi:hypothetical protein MUS1_09500 [Marinomonas ushuaiensis DSM 15871]|uniref:Uncharacterized protein n=1 Tax=Marinomonas ushuaiensis DSM 15871 TaxID=1122207 RepID=X7E6S0_9GAMM|nr:hypothetical protein [Marinomonas ushuaiensis]ETX11657.1 hypothetical protein MUS1_09500 [Marinomonas ushuaiensis DSM 15871]
MKKMCSVVLVFAAIIPFLGFGVMNFYPSLEEASYFSTTFGIGANLFSGAALGLAIYSFVLQQQQNNQFEEVTLKSLEGQVEALTVLKKAIDEQASTAKVTALNTLIMMDERRVQDLKEWGKNVGDFNKYSGGIKKAKARIEENRLKIELINDSL